MPIGEGGYAEVEVGQTRRKDRLACWQQQSRAVCVGGVVLPIGLETQSWPGLGRRQGLREWAEP